MWRLPLRQTSEAGLGVLLSWALCGCGSADSLEGVASPSEEMAVGENQPESGRRDTPTPADDNEGAEEEDRPADTAPEPGEADAEPVPGCGPQSSEELQELLDFVQSVEESTQGAALDNTTGALPFRCLGGAVRGGFEQVEVELRTPLGGTSRFVRSASNLTQAERSQLQAVQEVTPWQACGVFDAPETTLTLRRSDGTVQRFQAPFENAVCDGEPEGPWADYWALRDMLAEAGCSGESVGSADVEAAPRIIANAGCDLFVQPPSTAPNQRNWLLVDFAEAGDYRISVQDCSELSMQIAVHDPELAAGGVETPAATSQPQPCPSLEFELRSPLEMALSSQLFGAESSESYLLRIERIDG